MVGFDLVTDGDGWLWLKWQMVMVGCDLVTHGDCWLWYSAGPPLRSSRIIETDESDELDFDLVRSTVENLTYNTRRNIYKALRGMDENIVNITNTVQILP